MVGTEWLRLFIAMEKNPLISVDPDHIYKKDWILESFKNMGNYNTYHLINNKQFFMFIHITVLYIYLYI